MELKKGLFLVEWGTVEKMGSVGEGKRKGMDEKRTGGKEGMKRRYREESRE